MDGELQIWREYDPPLHCSGSLLIHCQMSGTHPEAMAEEELWLSGFPIVCLRTTYRRQSENNLTSSADVDLFGINKSKLRTTKTQIFLRLQRLPLDIVSNQCMDEDCKGSLHANGAYPKYAVNSSPIASACYSVKIWPFCKWKCGGNIFFSGYWRYVSSKWNFISGWCNYRKFRKLLEENKMLCMKMTF